MAADLETPMIMGTELISHRVGRLSLLLQKMRLAVTGRRGKLLEHEATDAIVAGLDAMNTEVGEIRDLALGELRLGAQALEAAHGVLKAVGAEGRLQPREPQPAAFEGVYVPEPERPIYLRDMARPANNIVLFPGVRRSRPEGGAR